MNLVSVQLPRFSAIGVIQLWGWLKAAYETEVNLPAAIVTAWLLMFDPFQQFLQMSQDRFVAGESANLVQEATRQVAAVWRSFELFLRGEMAVPDAVVEGHAEKAAAIHKLVFPEGRQFLKATSNLVAGASELRYAVVEASLVPRIRDIGGERNWAIVRKAQDNYRLTLAQALPPTVQVIPETLQKKLRELAWYMRGYTLQVVAWAEIEPDNEGRALRLLHPLTELAEMNRKNREAKDETPAVTAPGDSTGGDVAAGDGNTDGNANGAVGDSTGDDASSGDGNTVDNANGAADDSADSGVPTLEAKTEPAPSIEVTPETKTDAAPVVKVETAPVVETEAVSMAKASPTTREETAAPVANVVVVPTVQDKDVAPVAKAEMVEAAASTVTTESKADTLQAALVAAVVETPSSDSEMPVTE